MTVVTRKTRFVRATRGTLFIEYALIIATTVGVFAVIHPLFVDWVESIAASQMPPVMGEPTPTPTPTPSENSENCVAYVQMTSEGVPFGPVQNGPLPMGDFLCIQWA